MKYKTIRYKKKGAIAYIFIKPTKDGYLIFENLCAELVDVCAVIDADNSINVAVIKISGETFSFSAIKAANEKLCDAIDAVSQLKQILIAVIDGDAIGAGLELALSCDIRISSDRSRFALPNVANGTIPSCGGTQRLPRLVGQAKALELILTANTINAEEAFRIGLIQKVISLHDVDKESDVFVEKIAEKAPIALKFCKEAVNKGMDLTLEQGLRLEGDLYFLIQTTSDRMEGIRAFLSKRPPMFKGE